MRLASVVAAAPLPASLIGEVLTQVDGLDPTADRRHTLRALRGVDLLSLAEPSPQQDGGRSVHPLLVRAVAGLDPSPARRDRIRQAAIARYSTCYPTSPTPVSTRGSPPRSPTPGTSPATCSTSLPSRASNSSSWPGG
jgi:hypothetical protein